MRCSPAAADGFCGSLPAFHGMTGASSVLCSGQMPQEPPSSQAGQVLGQQAERGQERAIFSTQCTSECGGHALCTVGRSLWETPHKPIGPIMQPLGRLYTVKAPSWRCWCAGRSIVQCLSLPTRSHPRDYRCSPHTSPAIEPPRGRPLWIQLCTA